VLIFGPWFFGRIKFNFAALLVCVFCTHHFAIPDAIYRFNSGEYPSIYTKSIGFVKYLDILVVVIVVASLYNIKSFSSTFLRRNYPFFLPIFLVLGIMAYPSELQNYSNLLYISRSFLLLVAIALICARFNVYEIRILCVLATFAWTAKMLCAILIPAEAPLYREILGYKFNIPFAGDEYLTLGVYSVIVLSLSGVGPKTSDSKLIKYLLFSAFLLCIVAQRKGALQYFGVIFFVTAWGSVFGVKQKILNLILLIQPWLLFIFLIFVVPFLPDLMRLAFFDYANLLSSAVESLYQLFKDNYIASAFGIGPTGLYEIHGLNSLVDNEFAFGSEVGAQFRYVIWSIPYGRMLLNVGIFGSLIYVVYLLINMRRSSYEFYLYSTIFGIFYFQSTTPVESIAYGIAFAALPKMALANSTKVKSGPCCLQSKSV